MAGLGEEKNSPYIISWTFLFTKFIKYYLSCLCLFFSAVDMPKTCANQLVCFAKRGKEVYSHVVHYLVFCGLDPYELALDRSFSGNWSSLFIYFIYLYFSSDTIKLSHSTQHPIKSESVCFRNIVMKIIYSSCWLKSNSYACSRGVC